MFIYKVTIILRGDKINHITFHFIYVRLEEDLHEISVNQPNLQR